MATIPPSVSPIQTGPRSQTSTDRAVIALSDIWKIYRMGEIQVEALRGVTLGITEGEFVAIMGASGSGKSSLLNILGCLDRPTRGTYRLDNVDVSTFSKAQRADIRNQKIGFIFQSFNLLPRTSVWENVEAPMLYAGVTKGERAKRIEEVLSIVGIEEKAKALPNQLSGGQQQRVAIARALINKPAILLADEPTGNLDSHTSEEILHFLRKLNQQEKITLVMVTHDREIATYAARRIMMKDGLIVDDETKEQDLPVSLLSGVRGAKNVSKTEGAS